MGIEGKGPKYYPNSLFQKWLKVNRIADLKKNYGIFFGWTYEYGFRGIP